MKVIRDIFVLCLIGNAAVAADLLTWEPPALSKPVTVKVTNGKDYYGPFADTQDLLVRMPKTPVTNKVKIDGGRNVRLIGGAIKPDKGTTFLLRFADITGSVFIEGVDIDGKNLSGDGINVSGKKGFAPDVYIQNVRVMNINGWVKAEHADIFQAQGDIGSLHVDRLTGSSNYQGFFLPMQFGIRSAILRNVNLSFFPNEHHPVTYLLWMRDGETFSKTYPITLGSFYIEPRAGQTVAGQAVMPSSRSRQAPAMEKEGRVTWPMESRIEGCVISGKPVSGDFVPEGLVGGEYVSAGYMKR